jgi:hypothetical protein
MISLDLDIEIPLYKPVIGKPIRCPSTKVIQIRIQGFSGFILIINNTIKGCIVSK